jgi:hypothetical protein
MLKKLLILPVLLLTATSSIVHAQGGISATYEIRQEEPKQGLGFRVEKLFGYDDDFINVGIVGHTSIFNKNITLKRTVTNGGAMLFDQIDLSTFDIGLAVKLAANPPLLTPYLMGGLGFENYSLKADTRSGQVNIPADDRSLMLNASAGVQLRLIPAIRPFAEIRYSQNISEYEFEEVYDNLKVSKNRLAFGIQLRF